MNISQLLLEHFDHLLATPDAVERLNQTILDLAVRGKLVPQDPTDEPASELLKRIQIERARLVEEGEVRESDPLSAVDEAETSFQLPNGWMWTRIGEVSTVKGGKRVPKGDTLLESPTEHIYIRVTDMKNGTIVDQDLRYISDEVFKSIERYTIEKTDLYITIAGTIGAVGNVPEKFHGMNLTENAAKVTPFLLDKEYLKIILSSPFVQTQLLDKVNQMAQPKLALVRIKTTLIPLAPLAEQQRIVARVEQLFAQTRQLAALLSKAQTGLTHLNAATLHHLLAADTPEDFNARWNFIAEHFDLLYSEPEHIAPLRQAILELAVRGKLTRRDAGDEPASELLQFTLTERRSRWEQELYANGKEVDETRYVEPSAADVDVLPELPVGWCWATWGQISNWITYGFTRPMPHFEVGIPIVTARHVVNSRIDVVNTHRTSEEAFSELSEKDKPQPGDILITKDGTIGRAAVVGNEGVFCINQSVAVVWLRSCSINRRFLLTVIEAPITQEKIWSKAKGAALLHLSVTDFAKMPFPLPPLAEQQRIVARVEQLLGLCDALEAKLQAAQTQRAKLVGAVVAGVAAGVSDPHPNPLP